MFVKYRVFYGILVLYIFASMLFLFVLCDGPYYSKEIKWLSTERSGGIKKSLFCDRWKTHHACLSVPGKMRLYRWNAEKSDDINSDRDYVDRRERWENSAVRTNEMEISFFLFQIKHARCRTTLLMLDTVLFFFLPTFAKFFLKLENVRCAHVVKGGCTFKVYMYFRIRYTGSR